LALLKNRLTNTGIISGKHFLAVKDTTNSQGLDWKKTCLLRKHTRPAFLVRKSIQIELLYRFGWIRGVREASFTVHGAQRSLQHKRTRRDKKMKRQNIRDRFLEFQISNVLVKTPSTSATFQGTQAGMKFLSFPRHRPHVEGRNL
jgi:hypothetical protein